MYTSLIQPEALYQLLKKIHRREQDWWEGDLYERLYWHDAYELKFIPLESFNLDLFETDEDVVAEYQKQSANTQPPIVLSYDEENALLLVDGAHRAKSAKLRGDTQILAYVGVGQPSYDEYDDEEE